MKPTARKAKALKTPKPDVVFRDCVAVAQATLALDISDATKRKVLNSLTWIVSERFGKHSTGYQSRGALRAKERPVHEHVFPRRILVSLLLEGYPVAEVLSFCYGCLVTFDEHNSLAAVERGNPNLNGWERYSEAGIRVVTKKSGKNRPFARPSMEAEMRRYAKMLFSFRVIGTAEDHEPA